MRPGNGTPTQGETVYVAKCLARHGEKGAGKPNIRCGILLGRSTAQT
jgi:cytochrome c